MNYGKHFFLSTCMVWLLFVPAGAEDLVSPFERGAELFRMNQPDKAVPLLEQSLSSGAINVSVYVYLGIAYYQTGDFMKSLQVCLDGLAQRGTDRKTLAFNAGNAAFALGDYGKAEQYYKMAVSEDASYAAPVLNEANAVLRQNRLSDAAALYEQFLRMAPSDAQVPQIQKIIEAINEELRKNKPEPVRGPELIPEDMRQPPTLESADDAVRPDPVPVPPEESAPVKVPDGDLNPVPPDLEVETIIPELSSTPVPKKVAGEEAARIPPVVPEALPLPSDVAVPLVPDTATAEDSGSAPSLVPVDESGN